MKKQKFSFKALRRKLQWSQAEMAAVLHISRGYYNNLENGLRTPSAEVQKKLAYLTPLSEAQPETEGDHRRSYLKAKEALQARIHAVESSIANQQMLRGQLQNIITAGHEQEARMKAQVAILRELHAPIQMHGALKLLANGKNTRRLHRDLHSLYICEAKLAGKQTELHQLKQSLEIILSKLSEK